MPVFFWGEELGSFRVNYEGVGLPVLCSYTAKWNFHFLGLKFCKNLDFFVSKRVWSCRFFGGGGIWYFLRVGLYNLVIFELNMTWGCTI